MRSLPELEDDYRIAHLLNDFDKRYTGQDFGNSQNKSVGTISPDMLDGVSKMQPALRTMTLSIPSISSQNNLTHCA